MLPMKGSMMANDIGQLKSRSTEHDSEYVINTFILHSLLHSPGNLFDRYQFWINCHSKQRAKGSHGLYFFYQHSF